MPIALSDLNPAERHRHIAGTFTDRVRAAKPWDAPSPVAGWTARDVVRHLVEWFPPFLAAYQSAHGGGGIDTVVSTDRFKGTIVRGDYAVKG